VVVVSCVGWLSPLAAAEAGTLTEQLAREGVASLAAAAEQSGDPRKGAVVFHTQHLTCTKCHAAGTGPSPLGPNLAEVRGEGAGPQAGPSAEKGATASLAEHVVESLLEPSKTIRPEYRPVTILTEEGQSVSGIVVRESPEGIVLRDAADPGREITIPSGDVESRSESPVSLMPAGLVNLLTDRQQFLDLVKYLAEIGRGGRERAAELQPDPSLLAPPAPAAYEIDINHAGFIADWNDPAKAAEAFKRGEKIYNLVCVNCHGTKSAPGSLPTAPRFATSPLKAGADPYAMYRTLTNGAGQMVAQTWMVPSQKYDVIHYIREAYFRGNNPTLYASVTGDYLAALPKGSGRGPAPTNIERWRTHDYGPFLAASIEVGDDGTNVARKGLAVRLDAGPGGITRDAHAPRLGRSAERIV
jgi:putative heme-binding domain-containing protein